MTDLKHLRELCDAAPDEPLKDIRGIYTMSKSNTRFIAAADPQTVRALIDEIERLRMALSEIDSFDVQWAYGLDENIEKIKSICTQALKKTEE